MQALPFAKAANERTVLSCISPFELPLRKSISFADAGSLSVRSSILLPFEPSLGGVIGVAMVESVLTMTGLVE